MGSEDRFSCGLKTCSVLGSKEQETMNSPHSGGKSVMGPQKVWSLGWYYLIYSSMIWNEGSIAWWPSLRMIQNYWGWRKPAPFEELQEEPATLVLSFTECFCLLGGGGGAAVQEGLLQEVASCTPNGPVCLLHHPTGNLQKHPCRSSFISVSCLETSLNHIWIKWRVNMLVY